MGRHVLPQGNLPDPETGPVSLHWQMDSLPPKKPLTLETYKNVS